MRILTLRFFFAWVVLGSFAGCKLSDEDKETVIKVSPEFSLDLFEKLGDTRQFQVQISTVEPQPCENNVIDYSSNVSSDGLFLYLHEIINSPNCINAETIIETEASFGFLNNGSYRVEVTLKDVIQNLGTLSVTQDAYHLQLETQDGIELKHNELRRIPKGYIWGYVGFADANSGGVKADSFLAELGAKATAKPLSQGYYGYFIINENDQLAFVSQPVFTNFQTFYFKNNVPVSELESLLNLYRSGQNDQDFKIALYTAEGREL